MGETDLAVDGVGVLEELLGARMIRAPSAGEQALRVIALREREPWPRAHARVHCKCRFEVLDCVVEITGRVGEDTQVPRDGTAECLRPVRRTEACVGKQ